MISASGLQRVDMRQTVNGPALCDGGGDACVTAMLAAVQSEIGADGLQVLWHTASGNRIVVFATGVEHAAASDWTGMSDLAVRLAEIHDAGVRVQEGTCVCGWLATLAVPLSDGVVTVTGLFLRANQAAQRTGGQALLRLEPFLRPFLELWDVTRINAARQAGVAAAIDHCDIATLILDHRGGVIFANSACEAMLNSKDGVAVRGGKLCGSTLSDTLRVQAAIEHVLQSPDKGDARPIVAIRRAKRRPLMATIMPAFTAEDGTRPDVVVAYLFDPEQDLTALVEPACRYYGLSTSETRLTCRLAAGDSLAEAAESLHVREQTARSCLKQIFLKTETNRQGELVSLMVKSAIRVVDVGKVQVF